MEQMLYIMVEVAIDEMKTNIMYLYGIYVIHNGWSCFRWDKDIMLCTYMEYMLYIMVEVALGEIKTLCYVLIWNICYT